jgi:hypothetical protein
MCKFGTGRQGPQGATGATGAPGSQILGFTQVSTNIPSPLTITVFASASASGQLVYNGYINLQAVAALKATIIPVINGVQQTAIQSIVTLPAPTGGTSEVSVPVNAVITIVAGQSFAFDVVLSSYASTGKTLFTSINYNIQ